jgi:NAD(P)H-quinone oxidoreductase subunit 5
VDLADGLWKTQPLLFGVLLLINALTAFSMIRVFSMIWGNQPQPMTARSPEVFWPMTLPTVIMMGFVLHLPLILQSLSILPEWASLNKDVALLLTWSSIAGISTGAIVYLGKTIAKPVRLPWKPLQDLLAYDFYTAKLYRSSIVFGIDLISQITSWFDKYLVDGIVNLFGIFTIFGGQSLRYSTSGQAQFYVLTILLSIAVIGILVIWSTVSHIA